MQFWLSFCKVCYILDNLHRCVLYWKFGIKKLESLWFKRSICYTKGNLLSLTFHTQCPILFRDLLRATFCFGNWWIVVSLTIITHLLIVIFVYSYRITFLQIYHRYLLLTIFILQITYKTLLTLSMLCFIVL